MQKLIVLFLYLLAIYKKDAVLFLFTWRIDKRLRSHSKYRSDYILNAKETV